MLTSCVDFDIICRNFYTTSAGNLKISSIMFILNE